MKVMIVDDEPKAIDLIKNYLGHFRNVEVVATFRNGLKAFEYLQQNTVDLAFLDINMPHISGLSLSRMLDKKLKIIFTTAYSDYAVESYEVSAVDYLLKPITLDRFMLAMGKILDQAVAPENNSSGVLWIKSGARNHKLNIAEILYLQKEGNYMTYFTSGTRIVARESVSESLDHLPPYFCQTHKSYIVNIHQVSAVEKDELFIHDISIPVGASFKPQVMEHLKKFSNRGDE